MSIDQVAAKLLDDALACAPSGSPSSPSYILNLAHVHEASRNACEADRSSSNGHTRLSVAPFLLLSLSHFPTAPVGTPRAGTPRGNRPRYPVTCHLTSRWTPEARGDVQTAYDVLRRFIDDEGKRGTRVGRHGRALSVTNVTAAVANVDILVAAAAIPPCDAPSGAQRWHLRWVGDASGDANGESFIECE
jgi:hypothetical protein